MNLRSLRVFVLIMDEGTLSRAADRMNLSHSAASRLIQILEEEFDVVLFLRDKKRLIPTLEAEQFYPEALRILSQVDDIPNVLAQARSGQQPPLRIICHSRIQNSLVLPAMFHMGEAFPNQALKLEIYPRRDLARRIAHLGYDIVISTLPLPLEGLKPETLGSTELAVAVSRHHPLAARASLSIKDLAGYSYVALDETTVIRQIVDRELARADMSINVTHEVSTSAAAYRLVYRGSGFTFADPIALDPELESEIRLIPWRPVARVDFGYFLSPQSRLRETAQDFAALLREEFKKRSEASSI
ncbi:LysR family transcriptional regulator [Aestuariibius insulae]|uniref:LysR family transcriptional regulator n=1 Tax=Aestuariibius insulae TaxID=2058287 RepID=UPI00345EDD26